MLVLASLASMVLGQTHDVVIANGLATSLEIASISILAGKIMDAPPSTIPPNPHGAQFTSGFSLVPSPTWGLNATIRYRIQGNDDSAWLAFTIWNGMGVGATVSTSPNQEGKFESHIIEASIGDRYIFAIDLHTVINATKPATNPLVKSLPSSSAPSNAVNTTAPHCCTMTMSPCKANACSICCPGLNPDFIRASCGCSTQGGTPKAYCACY